MLTRSKTTIKQILLTYGIVTTIAIFLLMILIGQILFTNNKNDQIAYFENLMGNYNANFTRTYIHSTNLKNTLYNSPNVLNNCYIALQIGYESYKNTHLSRYGYSTSFEDYFQSLLGSYEDIRSIYIYNNNTKSILGSYKDDSGIYSFYKELSNLNHLFTYQLIDGYEQTIYPDIIEDPILGEQVYLFRYPLYNPKNNQPIGSLIIEYSFDDFKKNIQKNQANINYDHNIVMNLRNSNSSYSLLDKELTYDKNNYYIVNYAGLQTGTRLTTYIEKPSFYFNFIIPKIAFIVIGFIILMVTNILILLSLRSKISTRIIKIASSFQSVKKGDLDIRLPVNSSLDEINVIEESFNNMCMELQDYINQVYIAEIKKQSAELKAIQAQVNPHFLYNTLEVIRMDAAAEGNQRTSTMLYALGTLFRTSIKGKEIISLKEEIKLCKMYIHLMQLRYPEQLNVDYEIDEALYDNCIHKFTIQPLLENYILYGFKKSAMDNQLIIMGELTSDKDVKLTVLDNGSGIHKEKLRKLHEHINDPDTTSNDSIGLRLIHQRIQLSCGKKYGLRIESSDRLGTAVQIIIPRKRIEDEEV